MARRFASSTEQEIKKLLKQKDSENKRRLTKLRRNCSTLRKKAFRSRKTRRTQMLKLSAVYIFCLPVKQCIIKQLLDSAFAISGIIKVSVSVISLSLRLRLTTLLHRPLLFPGGILDPYLGIGEPLRVETLTLFRTKKILKYIPCLGQQPQFYYPV